MTKKNKKDNKKQQQQVKQVKQEAKQAAASGNYNKSNTQALRDAGVKSERIQSIKDASRNTQAAAANAQAARNNPTYQGAGFQNAIQNQAAGGAVGQAFYDSLDA